VEVPGLDRGRARPDRIAVRVTTVSHATAAGHHGPGREHAEQGDSDRTPNTTPCTLVLDAPLHRSFFDHARGQHTPLQHNPLQHKPLQDNPLQHTCKKTIP